MRKTASVAAMLVIGIVVAAPTAAQAQTTVTGGAEVGARTFLNQPADSQLAKFLQYNDLPAGLRWNSPYFHASDLPYGMIFQSLLVRATNDSMGSLQLLGRDIGLEDQTLSLRANRPGFADLQLRWDRIPHVFSTNARFLETETSPGVYTLPAPRPDTGTLNRSAYVAPVKERWDPLTAAFTFTPSTHWDMKAEFQHVDKNGYRPMGMVFGGSSNNASEINEPIDQSTNDLRLSEAFTQRHFQAMVVYAYSQFNNALSSVTAANPLVTVDSLKAGTANGRTALAPSNSAQSITGTAAASLPAHTRVAATLSYGWRSQNERLIAPTINSKNLDSLTRAGDVFPTGLFGNIHTTLVNLNASSRPIQPLSITARYRSYEFKDLTPFDSVPILVISDRTFAAGAAREAFPYTQKNAEVTASYHHKLPVTLTASYLWNRMDRDSTVRNVTRTDENGTKFAIDYSGLSWATVSLSYNHASRRSANGYHQVLTSENPDSRRFDEADRDRNALNLILTVTPIDQVTLSGTWQMGRDTFPNSPDGVQHDNSNVMGAEIDWTPNARFSLGAGYQREWYDNMFNSRYRTGSVDSLLNNPTWNWVATNIDSTSTAFVTFSAALIPSRLDLSGMWQISKSSFQMQAFNPVQPAKGTASQIAAATAMSFPTATQELQPLTLNLRYRVSTDWSLTARFQSEHFTNSDFRTTGLTPATGNYVFEGNSLLPYDASYLTFYVSYRPDLIRRPRSAM